MLKLRLEIQTDGKATPEEQVIRVQFFDPTGREAEHYRRNVPVKGLRNWTW